jgi:hypothetical protein
MNNEQEGKGTAPGDSRKSVESGKKVDPEEEDKEEFLENMSEEDQALLRSQGSSARSRRGRE